MNSDSSVVELQEILRILSHSSKVFYTTFNICILKKVDYVMVSFIFPLSPMQSRVWALLNSGLSMSEIADKLKRSPQYIHQTRRNAESKLIRALTETAEANDLQIKRIRPREGLLLGYHPALKQDAFVTYTTRNGIKVWYWYDHPETITDDTFLAETRRYLLDIAVERHITLTEEEQRLHPAKLANLIFRKLMPGMRS